MILIIETNKRKKPLFIDTNIWNMAVVENRLKKRGEEIIKISKVIRVEEGKNEI